MADKNQKKANLPEGVSQEMVTEWKGKYGENKVEMLRLPMDDVRSSFYDVIARHPDRLIIGEYLRYASSNPNKANEILVKNCLLSGVDRVLADDDLFNSALSELADMIPMRKAERVKL